MSLDNIGNTFAASFGSLQQLSPRVNEKKAHNKVTADKFAEAPAKYMLPQSISSSPIAQLGITKYVHMAADRMKLWVASVPQLKAQSAHRVLSKTTWIRGMRFPKGTTLYYNVYGAWKNRSKWKLWGAHLVRNQVINGIKCGRGYVIFVPTLRGRVKVAVVTNLSHDQYIKSHWGLIKCAKNTSLGIRDGFVGATLAAPKVLSKDLTLPMGTRIYSAIMPVHVYLGKNVRYKGQLLMKGANLSFSYINNRQVSQVRDYSAHVVKGVKCNLGRTIYFNTKGTLSSIVCHSK